MEDDLRKLTEYGLLEKDGNRYFTNIVIFTHHTFADGKLFCNLGTGIIF